MAEIFALPSVSSETLRCESIFEEPPPTNLEHQPQKRDDYQLAGLGLGFMTAAAGVGKSIVDKIWGGALDAVLKRGEQRILRHFPPDIPEGERRILETIYKSKSASQAVKKIRAGWPDLTPFEAVRYVFEFLYIYDPNHFLLGEKGSTPDRLTPMDIQIIAKEHGLSIDQIYNAFQDIDNSFGWSKEAVRDAIYQAIFDARWADPAEAATRPDGSITTTQKMVLREMRHERIALMLDAVGDILTELSASLKEAEAYPTGDAQKVALGRYEIDIGPEVIGRSAGRFAVVEIMELIAGKIDRHETLTPDEEGIIDRLFEENPVVRKIIEARTHFADNAINGTNLALTMMEQAELGEQRWFLKVLDEVRGVQGPVRTTIVLQNDNGDIIERYAFSADSLDSKGGKRISLFAEGRPHPAAPFSFAKGNIIVVKGESTSVESAILVRDGRGRTFSIVRSDLRHLDQLAKGILETRSVRTSEAGQAFLRFFNRVQAVAVATLGVEDYALEDGSPKLKIARLARNLTKQNWSAVLEQDLHKIIRDFSSAAAQTELRGNLEGDGMQETELSRRVAQVRTAHVENFSPDRRSEFKKLMRGLENAIERGETSGRRDALSKVMALVIEQTGLRVSDHLSWDFFQELRTWLGVRSIDVLEGYIKGEMPADLRDIIIARGVDTSRPPSIERARELAQNGSYQMALLEYDRVTAEPGTRARDIIIALAEKAELAVNLREPQFQRANRAVELIRLLEARGEQLSAQTREILDRLPPLNSGAMVVVKKRPVSKPKVAEERPTVETAFEDVFEDAVQFPDTQPRAIRWIKKGVREAAEIGSPALFGAAVFLGVGGAVRAVFGAPETEMEGLLQGYNTIGLSMAAESAAHKGIERFVWRNVPADVRPIAPQPQPFSLVGTLGNLGLGMIVYRLVHGASDWIGIDELFGEMVGPFNVNEVVGLTGTGALFASSQTILSKVAPSVASDIARHRAASEAVRRTGGSLVYESAWSSKIISGLNILKRGAAALMIADAVPTIAEAINNNFDDRASILARNEWYSAYREYNSSRGMFGGAQDVPWYERVWHSAYNAADVVVPASWTRNIMPLWDDQAADWYATCRWKIKNGASDCHPER